MKTQDIVPVIVGLAAHHVREVWTQDSGPELGESMYKAAENPKLWKRLSKSKLSTFLQNMDLAWDDFVDGGWEYYDVLDPTPLSPDCICRAFGNDILADGLDPAVVTDPTDTKILVVAWHSD